MTADIDCFFVIMNVLLVGKFLSNIVGVVSFCEPAEENIVEEEDSSYNSDEKVDFISSFD